jgi:hypothetical protein
VNLTTAGDATGSINTTAIPSSEADGLSSTGFSARTFGEAQLDFDALTAGLDPCVSFGSAYLKSRSSDSFTAALKDFIAPVATDLANCGNVIIHKVTVPSPDPTDTLFAYTTTGGLDPSTFSLKDGGTQDYGGDVLAGSYSVTETDPAPNFALTNLSCADSDTSNGTTITTVLATGTVSFDLKSSDTVECTYTNTLQRGALMILKESTKTGNPLVSNAGAVFSYDGASVTDNGTGDEDSTIGEVCVSGLLPGDYTVNETTPPSGYGDASETDQTATVVVGTNCTDNQPTGTGVVTFTNPPLSDIQVNFRDGGSGETSATITCDNTTGTGSDTAATGWDTSRTVTGVEAPTTVHCTIVIDP